VTLVTVLRELPKIVTIEPAGPCIGVIEATVALALLGVMVKVLPEVKVVAGDASTTEMRPWALAPEGTVAEMRPLLSTVNSGEATPLNSTWVAEASPRPPI
jgi:hypothetical protein